MEGKKNIMIDTTKLRRASKAIFIQVEEPVAKDIAGMLIAAANEIDKLQNFIQAPNALKPISTAPKDGRYILLFGDSGYTTTPMRCEVCRYDKEYRPLQPWVTHANDSFEDGGEPATHWMDLPINEQKK